MQNMQIMTMSVVVKVQISYLVSEGPLHRTCENLQNLVFCSVSS